MGTPAIVATATALTAVALLASSCGSSTLTAQTEATTTTTTAAATTGSAVDAAAVSKFESCLRNHGVKGTWAFFTQRPPQGRPPRATGQPGRVFRQGNLTPAQRATLQKAFAACRKLAPKGGFRFGAAPRDTPQFARYRACMRQHGVTLGQAPASTKKFRDATKACGPLLARPSSGGGR